MSQRWPCCWRCVSGPRPLVPVWTDVGGYLAAGVLSLGLSVCSPVPLLTMVTLCSCWLCRDDSPFEPRHGCRCSDACFSSYYVLSGQPSFWVSPSLCYFLGGTSARGCLFHLLFLAQLVPGRLWFVRCCAFVGPVISLLIETRCCLRCQFLAA